MQMYRIAILSPGEMGHSVGRCLIAGGFDVATCLTGRSERTRMLTAAAGIRDVPDLDELVRESDLILAILVPDQAHALALQVADVMKRTGSSPAYADCNAISPDSAREIDMVITSAGGRFIDAGIIGGPPGGREKTRFYASGPHEEMLSRLDGHGILVRTLGGEVGRASGIKDVYAPVTKGTSASMRLRDCGRGHGRGEVAGEFSESQSQRLKAMDGVRSLSARPSAGSAKCRKIAATTRPGLGIARISRRRGTHFPPHCRKSHRPRTARDRGPKPHPGRNGGHLRG